MRQGAYSTPKYLLSYPSQSIKKWPQDIECIIKSSNPDKGSLYLSNVQAAQNPATVKKLRIGGILSCAKGYIISHPKTLVPHYKYIPGQDKQSFDISKHFDQAIEFIKHTLQNTNIIVHCIAGVSRSVSMVIAYFMKHRNLTYDQAYHQVKAKRKIISPNDGFIKHLRQFQHRLRSQRKKQRNMSPRRQVHSQNQIEDNRRTSTGSLYTPQKSYDYYKSVQLSKNVRNPQSNMKQQSLKQYPSIDMGMISPSHKRNYSGIKYYQKQSQSLNFIPNQKQENQGLYSRYGLSMSKALSPRKQYQSSKKELNVSLSPTKFNKYFNQTSTEVKRTPTTTQNSPRKIQLQRNQLYINQSQKTPSPRHQIHKNQPYKIQLHKNQLHRTQLRKQDTKRGGYFDAMNSQLNQKIQAIRKKYQEQRHNLMKSYASRGDSSQKYKNDTPIHKNSIPVKQVNYESQRYRNVYTDRKPVGLQRTFTQKNTYNRNFNKYETLSPYNSNFDDVKLSRPYNNLDSIYIPRVTTGYGGFGRRYY